MPTIVHRSVIAVLMALAAAIIVAHIHRPVDADEIAQADDAADGQTADDPAKAFSSLYDQWVTLGTESSKLVARYLQAGEDERKEIREKSDALTEQQRKLYPKLQSAALAAYRANPNDDEAVVEILFELMGLKLNRDEYEAAAEIANLLVDNNATGLGLYESAGTAAYCLQDFDKAAQLFKRADEADGLTESGKRQLDSIPKQTELWKKELELRAAEAQADDLPRVKFETSQGPIVIELFENEAPQSVANFIHLVEEKFYDGLTFHRVLGNFMAQGGCPRGDGTGGPGYKIYCECYEPDHRKHFRGTLSMAHAGRNTGGSQFFLTFRPTPHLDGRHTAFGRVIEGLDVLAKLQRIDPTRRNPGLEPDKIIKATVVRKRDHAYEPTKVK